MTKKKLLDQVVDVLRLKNYAFRTEQAYTNWIRRFILYHKKRHPNEMGEAEIEAFLTYLAVDRGVAPSTQNQALAPFNFFIMKSFISRWIKKSCLHQPNEPNTSRWYSANGKPEPSSMNFPVYTNSLPNCSMGAGSGSQNVCLFESKTWILTEGK